MKSTARRINRQRILLKETVFLDKVFILLRSARHQEKIVCLDKSVIIVIVVSVVVIEHLDRTVEITANGKGWSGGAEYVGEVPSFAGLGGGHTVKCFFIVVF